MVVAGVSVGSDLQALSQAPPLLLVRIAMSKQVFALALCRVSSLEQLENNSLNRQRDAVLKAANELNATIPDNGWWSGSVSSKRGTNVRRKDLQEMVERCKKEKRIKYVIVDEPDRFMRSIKESSYFEVIFELLGVKVWYASDPELNRDDLGAKLLKFTKYLSAEGSNEERQNKSIAGQTKALMEGRYPFSPKPGYQRGYERAVQEIHSVRGPALQAVLVRIASRQVTPSMGLIELNKSAFTQGRSLYKMDKFRKIITDPYYAGIVEINKQVKMRNENGLHTALITKEQHYALLKIMSNKAKNQSGPRKNGNPKYPLNNIVSCDLCKDKKGNRYVGFDTNNGKNKEKVYEKYRCRTCNRYINRQDLHAQVEWCFKGQLITDKGQQRFNAALEIVWKQQEGQVAQEVNRIRHKIKKLNEEVVTKVEAVTDPGNSSIKDVILGLIGKKRAEIAELEEQLEKLAEQADDDKEQFLKFAFSFIENMGGNFLQIPAENRLRCKQIVFPAGFRVDANNKVYTPEISPLYRLASNKKAPTHTSEALLVRVKRL